MSACHRLKMSAESYRKYKAKHTNNAQPKLLFYYTPVLCIHVK